MITPISPSGDTFLARASRLCRRLSHDERGSISVLTAISLVVLLGFGALGVDTALWMRARNDAQSAADAAANSAGAAASALNSTARIQADVDAAAAANGFQNGVNGVTVTLNNPPVSGAYAGNAKAYEVIITAPQKVYLASAIRGATAPIVKGRAVALLVAGTPAPTFPTCILGLSPQPSQIDVTFNGNTTVTANNCDVDADSPSASSVNTNGGGTVHATNVRTVGGVSGGNIFVTGKIYKQQASIPDPYAGLQIPTGGSTSANNNWSGHIINPTGGVVQFNGDVRVSGNTTVDGGIYIINNGSFSMAGQNSITGNGVTIILTSSNPSSDNGVFSITGGGALNITAPTTGPTAGIALWADKNLPNNEDKFTGGTANGITGAIYLPSHDVKFAGNSGSASKCGQLIGYNLIFTGTPTFNHNCNGVGTLDPQGQPTPASWSLVE
jgi:Flp pilus assembly protein TadG